MTSEEKTMRSFIAQSISSILNEIRCRIPEGPAPTAEPLDAGRATAHQVMGETAYFSVDARAGEKLATKSFIFGDPESKTYVIWHVFAESSKYSDREQIFTYSGSIEGASDSKSFVELAYSLIFMRPADQGALEIYPSLLKNGDLSQRELLRILADSEEARILARNLVIIPEPSRWLPVNWRPATAVDPLPCIVLNQS